jgi:hypothetical protein
MSINFNLHLLALRVLQKYVDPPVHVCLPKPPDAPTAHRTRADTNSMRSLNFPKKIRSRFLARHIFLFSLLVLQCTSAMAASHVMCVWDPLGSQGDYFNMLKDYQIAAKRWNVDLSLKAYTDEARSVEDFKNGKCDIINMIGYRARLFNKFSGTLEAAGALENYADMREALSLINSPRAAKYLASDDFEVVGIIPLGAGYPFVNDRRINGLGPAKGKKIAVVDWDPVQTMLVRQVEAVPAPMDLTQFGPRFNAGDVDILLVPMVMYKPLELARGIGTRGGIVRRPILQFTMQLIDRQSRFPAEFASSSRNYMLNQINFAIGVIRNQERAVEPGMWIYSSTSELREYNRLMAGARAALTAAGYYDHRMLGILKRIRCQTRAATDADCGPEAE